MIKYIILFFLFNINDLKMLNISFVSYLLAIILERAFS
nr:MAG TPA: hypothetical protein [Bacteriophage sp.]